MISTTWGFTEMVKGVLENGAPGVATDRDLLERVSETKVQMTIRV